MGFLIIYPRMIKEGEMPLIFRFPSVRKVSLRAFGKSSSWLNRAEYVICSERPIWSIQLISFDINCLLSVGLGPGKKLNFEWYKQIVLHGSQPLWRWAKACNLQMCAAPALLTRWTLWFDLLSCCHLLCLIHGSVMCEISVDLMN